MPSRSHQWLVLWVARKMAQDGYRVTNVDGAVPQGGYLNQLNGSLSLGDLRPDVWGVAKDGSIALGEAKTRDDVPSAHTVAQLRRFCAFRPSPGNPAARLYVGVPRSCTKLLDHALQRAGMAAARNVVRLHIPDVILEVGDESDG